MLKLLAEHGGQVLQRGRLEPGAPTSLNASSSVGAPTSPDASTLPDASTSRDASTSPDASTEHAPTEVQFLEFPSEAALDSSINDPRRTAMAAERDAVIARTDIHRIRLR